MLATPVVSEGGTIRDRSFLAILLVFGCFGEVAFVTVLESSCALFCCVPEETVCANPAAKRENQDGWESAFAESAWSGDEAGLVVTSDVSKNQHLR